jgi:hypothetical protein
MERRGWSNPRPNRCPGALDEWHVAKIKWAERIKLQVDDEFDRVVRSFRSAAGRQSDAASRADTEAIIAILEGRRYMVFVMYGVVLLIVFFAVAAAAMKDARLAKAAASAKSK